MITMLLMSAAFAMDPPPRPDAPPPVAGQCARVIPINKGERFSTELTIDVSISDCSAVAVPLSDYADLLATEVWAKNISTRYQIDTAELMRERDWYKQRLNLELEPKPWLQRPGTQRWLGRIETIVIVGIVTAGIGATYHYSAGAGQ
tara:strand:+ start:3196 stop:3636 length:441 start_codon:yes stop_codon:yes gene_type:complete